MARHELLALLGPAKTCYLGARVHSTQLFEAVDVPYLDSSVGFAASRRQQVALPNTPIGQEEVVVRFVRTGCANEGLVNLPVQSFGRSNVGLEGVKRRSSFGHASNVPNADHSIVRA